MKLSLGISPCPNDTFIFDALVNKKIDTDELQFDVVLEDVETLNKWAIEGRLDITKLSFPAFFAAKENYLLLRSGSAIAFRAGPLLISSKAEVIGDSEIENYTIALPGENTTAHLLFSLAYPAAKNKKFMRFDTIEEFVSNHPGTLGVIIHENRFTYEEKGLFKVKDLGEFWENKTQAPIPLGGIAINQTVKRSTALTIDKLIKQSVEYAFRYSSTIPEYVKQHSATMSEEVMRKHIVLYVNDFSLDMGEKGKQAIASMYRVYQQLHNQDHDDADFLFL